MGASIAMDLGSLHQIASERRARWERAGASRAVVDGSPTDKPAAWLTLDTAGASGQLILWVSGEAEMEWGTSAVDGQRHYDLDSASALRTCVDELESVLGLR